MASTFSSKSYSASTKRKEAFSEELSSVVTRRSVVSSSEGHVSTLSGSDRSGEEVFDVYSVNQNFKADEGDSISLKKGDLVEILDSGQESFKLRSRNSSYLLDKYKNLNSYIESGQGGTRHSILKNTRSPSHSSGSAKSLSSRLSGGVHLSREDMYGSPRAIRENLSPIDTRMTHEYSRAYASPRSYDATRSYDGLVTDTYRLKLNDPSLPYSSPRCYDYLGSCGGSRVYDPLRPFNSRRFYESLEFAEPKEPPKTASYGYYEPPEPRKVTSPTAIHVAYSPNPYDPYAHYNAQPMSTYEPRKFYEMSPERDDYEPVVIRKPVYRLSESPEPLDIGNMESKYRQLPSDTSVSRRFQASPEPPEVSRPAMSNHEPRLAATMQRINIRASILGGKKLNSGSK